MKYHYCILGSFFLTLLSCVQPHGNAGVKRKSAINITRYTGNALVFFNEGICRDRLYLVPVSETDSSKFKGTGVTKINETLSIQIHLDHKSFFLLLNDKNKALLLKKPCYMPYDSMYYSKVFISYKNYSKTIMWVYDKNNKIVKANDRDSCNSKAIMETDSSELTKFHIYK